MPMLLTLIYILLIIFLKLPVTVKRWHDRDKSGWWSLVGSIPFIGQIWSFIELGLLVGTRGPNQYGPDPTQPEM